MAQETQADGAGVGADEAIPLPQISAWSEIAPGMSLFDSVVIFQNLPFAENLASHPPAGYRVCEVS